MYRKKYDLLRFWELFTPHLSTFNFWLASAAFSFFASQSLMPIKSESIMSLMREVLAWGFLIFGYACVVILLWLVIAWLCGLGVLSRERGKSKQGYLIAKRNKLKCKLEQLNQQINEVENERDKPDTDEP